MSAPNPQLAPQPGPGAFKLALPGIVLVLACLLPYLHKAYTIDDPWFLHEARQILKTPLHPMSFEICWIGDETCAVAANLGAGARQALMGYLLVPVILGGGAEWLAHTLQILLAALAVFEMVRLALRCGCGRMQATVAGLLLPAIPPFLPMASTAMPDLLATTLGITGMERLLAWKGEGRWWQAVAAGFALGFAPFARPHLALLLALGGLWLFDGLHIPSMLRQLRDEAYRWSPLLIAFCVLVTLNLATREDSSLMGRQESLIGIKFARYNLFCFLLYFAIPIPLAEVWVGLHWRKVWLLVGPGALAVVMHFAQQAPIWPLAAILYGAATLAHLLYTYWRARDQIGLLLALWLLIPLPVVFYTHLPTKYLMGVLPAVVLICVRAMWGLTQPLAVTACGFLLVVCTAYSCLILKADADFAEHGRRAAAELIAPYVRAGEKVWFGGQWGFFWYAERAGAQISRPDQPGPRPGELLAVGLMESGNVTRDRFPRRVLVDLRRYRSEFGRTMGSGAGLYSNAYGSVLWVWDTNTTDDYELWRVQ